MQVLLFCFVVAAAACYVFGFWLYDQLLRWNIVDKPNARSSHTVPTARGGGIGIIAAILFGTVLLLSRGSSSTMLVVLGPFALFLAGISFVDDLRSLPAGLRFACHGMSGLAVLLALGWPEMLIGFSADEGVTVPEFLALAVIFLWIVGYTNAFNFMDGINGIATGQAIVTALGSAAIVVVATGSWLELPVLFACITAGASAGFLPHNFPRARMFMGDVSSAPLGFLLASLAVWIANRYGWWLFVPLVLLHTNFVLDTGITLIRRVIRREKWYAPHREHFYQRLVRAGRSHSYATGWEMGLQMVTAALAVWYVATDGAHRPFFVAAVLGIWGVFFMYCEWEFRRGVGRIPDVRALPAPDGVVVPIEEADFKEKPAAAVRAR